MAGLQCFRERDLIHQTAARAIDQPRALFHARDILARKDIARLFRHGRMECDEIRPRQQFRKFHLLHANFNGALFRKEWIEGNHLHLQPIGTVSDNAADIAAADQPQGFGEKLHPHEAVLFPFARLGGG